MAHARQIQTVRQIDRQTDRQTRRHTTAAGDKKENTPPSAFSVSPLRSLLCVCPYESQEFTHRSLSCSLPSRATAPTSDCSRVQYSRTSVLETTANPLVCLCQCVSVSVLPKKKKKRKKSYGHMVFSGVCEGLSFIVSNKSAVTLASTLRASRKWFAQCSFYSLSPPSSHSATVRRHCRSLSYHDLRNWYGSFVYLTAKYWLFILASTADLIYTLPKIFTRLLVIVEFLYHSNENCILISNHFTSFIGILFESRFQLTSYCQYWPNSLKDVLIKNSFNQCL